MSWELEAQYFIQSGITDGIILDGQLRGINEQAETALAVIWKFDNSTPVKIDEKWFMLYRPTDNPTGVTFSEVVGHID